MKKPDMRGLSKKGKKDYPTFTREEIELQGCELCGGYQTVKKYQIIRKSGNTSEIFMCDSCLPLVPFGVEVLCLEDPTKTEEEPIEFEPETDEEQGDSLLL